MATTSKKQKFVGIQEYINPQTGEVVPMQVTKLEDRDFNFHKVWLQHLITSLDEISNKKMELAFWIIENLNTENQLIMTQRTISQKTGISLGTVRDTMKALQNGKPAFLVKINSGHIKLIHRLFGKVVMENEWGLFLIMSITSTKKQKQHKNR